MNRFEKNIDFIINNSLPSDNLELLSKIQKYISGKITSETLTQKTDKYEKEYIADALNKIINYNVRDIHYYVELPQNINFKRIVTPTTPAIIAATPARVWVPEDMLFAYGPKEYKGDLIEDELHEVTGPFDKGLELSVSDWYKVIAKYKYLAERMYNMLLINEPNTSVTFENFKKRLNIMIKEMINIEDTEHDELISKLKFQDKKVYVTYEKVLRGLPPFDVLLESQKENEEVYKLKRTISNIKNRCE